MDLKAAIKSDREHRPWFQNLKSVRSYEPVKCFYIGYSLLAGFYKAVHSVQDKNVVNKHITFRFNCP